LGDPQEAVQAARAQAEAAIRALPELPAIDVTNRVSWFEPVEEVVKRRETTVTARINYTQGGTYVHPYYDGNAAEIARIDSVLKPIMSEGYRTRSVKIVGYSSIEGQWDTNHRLSQGRVDGFQKWLAKRYGYLGNVSVEVVGEDWEGLLGMIEEDRVMPLRNEAVHIIRNIGIFDGREKMLMDIGAGVPYRYMYRYFFPKLRRMEITFGYEVGAMDGRRAEQMMQSRPGDLSHAEMTRTLKAQGGDRLAMYRKLAAQFPDDPIALINASSAELAAGNVAEAWGYLVRVQGDPRAANNIAIYRALTSVSEPSSATTTGGTYRYKVATE
jgi:outer membrane protein OmpA-like peptidoglycan-associated protein